MREPVREPAREPATGPATAYLLERAWVGGRVEDDVLVEIEGGRFTRVEALGRSRTRSGDATPQRLRFPRVPGETARVPGLTLPGLANSHSHAFHRALRGRTQRGGGTFWTWREQMYDLAARLDPDDYLLLATALFREMVAAGIATVGEFHYLHHAPDGRPYAEPNETGLVLVEAARRAGIRIALLDTCYLSSGFGAPVEGAQRRYTDGDAERWARRVEALDAALAGEDHVVVGAAVHSVRAVPREQLPTVVEAARGRPLHVHLSEQRAENDACRAAYDASPTQVLADAGVLGPLTSVVHATHLDDADVRALGESRTRACFCPTTERDLGDGVGPSRALHDAGSPLTLGSDSHAVVDLFEEMRAVELDERLVAESRGHWAATGLLEAGLRHDALGFADAGEIRVGARADLVTLDTATPRTAGTGADEHTAVFAATGADVTRVVVDGRLVHTREQAPDVGRELAAAIDRVWKDAR